MRFDAGLQLLRTLLHRRALGAVLLGQVGGKKVSQRQEGALATCHSNVCNGLGPIDVLNGLPQGRQRQHPGCRSLLLPLHLDATAGISLPSILTGLPATTATAAAAALLRSSPQHAAVAAAAACHARCAVDGAGTVVAGASGASKVGLPQLAVLCLDSRALQPPHSPGHCLPLMLRMHLAQAVNGIPQILGQLLALPFQLAALLPGGIQVCLHHRRGATRRTCATRAGIDREQT